MLLVLDLLTCTDKHHCVVGPVKVTDIFILNLREAAFMEMCAWWTSFLPCPPPSLILGPSCSTSPLDCNSSSPWTISFSRAFPTKYMSQRLPQASDKPIHFFVCFFIKLEKNFGSWGDGSCSTKTILSLGSGFASVSEVENYISWLSAPSSEKSRIVKVLGIVGHMVSATAT